jgi:hypothetical protein
MRLVSSTAALAGLVLVASGGAVVKARDRRAAAPAPLALRAVLVAPRQVTSGALRRFRREGANAVVVCLADNERRAAAEAAARVKERGLELYYWVEVGRNPAMAEAHPQWMASLQGPHPEWRHHFPNAPQPGAGEVVKNYPWVPVLYREAFDAQLRRVKTLLDGVPSPKGIFLNDLQGAPSACGCGNNFCRWVPDYGPIRTATQLPPDAAARFTAAARALSPGAEIIPVWTTECEEHETARGQPCDGVPCFGGACWYTWTEQLMPLARENNSLAVLAPYRAFQRDQPRYGPTAGWVKTAVASFSKMPPLRKGTPVTPERLVTVLQGWEITPEQRQAQIDRTREAGARGYVMAEMKIDQEWEPRIVKAQPINKTGPPPAQPEGHHHGVGPK